MTIRWARVRWAGLLLQSVDPHPVAHVAAAAQVAAIRTCLGKDPDSLSGPEILAAARSAALDGEKLLGADDRVSARRKVNASVVFNKVVAKAASELDAETLAAILAQG